jgi:hypothetical protein
MAALHGKEDPLLEASRFPRFLRQAHDAEIADVRKINETDFEITRRSAPVLGEFVPAPPPPVSNGPGQDAEPAQPASRPAVAALRFRRGSRTMARPPEIPLVGVVSFGTPEPEPPAEVAEKPKRRGAPRKRVPRAKKGE